MKVGFVMFTKTKYLQKNKYRNGQLLWDALEAPKQAINASTWLTARIVGVFSTVGIDLFRDNSHTNEFISSAGNYDIDSLRHSIVS